MFSTTAGCFETKAFSCCRCTKRFVAPCTRTDKHYEGHRFIACAESYGWIIEPDEAWCDSCAKERFAVQHECGGCGRVVVCKSSRAAMAAEDLEVELEKRRMINVTKEARTQVKEKRCEVCMERAL